MLHPGGAPLEDDLRTLASAKAAWAGLSSEIKLALLRTVKANVHAVAAQWAQACAQAKGLRERSPLAGEEWISGPWALMYALTRFARTLEDITVDGDVDLPRARRRHGRTVLDVYPRDLYDRFLLMGIRAEVWMHAGITPDRVRTIEPHNRSGELALVLGAGNISSITPLDALYKLIAENAVCLVKMNPVNGYLQPILESAFDPFVKAGFLRFTTGGAELGAYLCAHPAVDTIHITGSETAYRAVVREAGGKPVTSELGNVSPAIVVPGEWTDAQLRYQAEHIATQKAHNAGFNCVATQVMILSREWEQKDALKAQIQDVFDAMENRPEYYPGAAARRARIGAPEFPLRTMVEVAAGDRSSAAFTSEAFCGALVCVELPGTGEAFIRNAVDFANSVLAGTLGANIIVSPRSQRELRPAIDRAIADLRYGCIGVNAWTGVGYFIAETPWGAYPGHTRTEPGSGLGVVHNALLLEDTEKTVVYAPFRSFPKPSWFVTNRAAAQIGAALCDFELDRSPAAFARVSAIALRG